jgi:hypothetical protein
MNLGTSTPNVKSQDASPPIQMEQSFATSSPACTHWLSGAEITGWQQCPNDNWIIKHYNVLDHLGHSFDNSIQLQCIVQNQHVFSPLEKLDINVYQTP